MKKHIITLSGYPGSGKSSTGNGLATKLGYTRFSSGDFMRNIARERGISLEEFNTLAKTDPAIDNMVDGEIRRVGEQDNLVIDSRLAYHWIPKAFKVFLTLDLHIAAERIFHHIQKESRVGQDATSIEEVYQETVRRVANEQSRYTTLYGLTYDDPKNYDLVVDTGTHNLEEVIQIILDAYTVWCKE